MPYLVLNVFLAVSLDWDRANYLHLNGICIGLLGSGKSLGELSVLGGVGGRMCPIMTHKQRPTAGWLATLVYIGCKVS